MLWKTHLLRRIFVFICGSGMLGMERVALFYDVCAKIGWWVGLVDALTHCVLTSSHGGNGDISSKFIAKWAQVQKGQLR